MKKTNYLKKFAAVTAAAVMSCVLAVGTFAAGQDYRLNSADIKVGETWSMSVPATGVYDWSVSSLYIEYGPNLADVPGVLKQVSYETADGVSTITYKAMQPGSCTVTLTDRSMVPIASATVNVTETGTVTPSQPVADKGSTAAPSQSSPAASTSSAPETDTRTAQQKEIDEMIANGTWEEGYTTCEKCGYHNWTRKGEVYVCDTCGNEVTAVVGPKCVKGYTTPAAAAAAPETHYATAAQAQTAADKREAAYAAAVAAYQRQIAAQNAAYLAALKG